MNQPDVITIKVDRKTRHDLRTPLNQIIGFSELLGEEAQEQGLEGFSADLQKIRNAANQLVEMVDAVFGSIQIESAQATPLPDDTGIVMEDAGTPAETRKGDGSCILVVDDNEMNRQVLARRLFKSGYKVRTAADGMEALEFIENEHMDLVVLDILMPGISGLETLAKIRGKFSLAELPVIMATALNRSEDIIQALRLEANDYVTKPLDFPVVLARIQTQLVLRRLTTMKDEFLRIASHDLKAPLFAILGASKILHDKVPPEFSRFTRMIHERSAQMRWIIEDFLDFQALEDGRLRLEIKPADLNAIARRVMAANAEYAAAKEIELHAELCDPIPLIQADEARLDQVASNLIGNAIKFSPPGARAVIRTLVRDGQACLEVSDTGPGLRDGDFAKLFMKYARLSNKPTGAEKSSGLGLAICRQLIELHGGQITARNNPDGGSTFSFGLPLSGPGQPGA